MLSDEVFIPREGTGNIRQATFGEASVRAAPFGDRPRFTQGAAMNTGDTFCSEFGKNEGLITDEPGCCNSGI